MGSNRAYNKCTEQENGNAVEKGMADEEHLERLREGVASWNAWRDENPALPPDLTGADLSGADLTGADLYGADLTRANLSRAKLPGADLSGANLPGADLYRVDLYGADVAGADLTGANLCRADLSRTNLTGARLFGAYLSEARLFEANLTRAALTEANVAGAFFRETILANVDLTAVKGLADCRHVGPSVLDFRTLQRLNDLPLAFLRGVGLPDILIDYLPSLTNQPIQYYSCFISYSSRDEAFVQRLYADLQNAGVRCWFAPEDLPIGAKIRPTLDEAIRVHDKLLLVLSEHAVESGWVEQEVESAFEQERKRKTTVLFPVRVDDAVMESKAGWAAHLKRSRNIGDFRAWKDHDRYQKGFQRLLRDLRPPKGES